MFEIFQQGKITQGLGYIPSVNCFICPHWQQSWGDPPSSCNLSSSPVLWAQRAALNPKLTQSPDWGTQTLQKTLHNATLQSSMSSKPTSLCPHQEFGDCKDTMRWHSSQNCGGIFNGIFSVVLKVFMSSFPILYDDNRKKYLLEDLFGKH